VVKPFVEKGPQAFFETGSKPGIQPHHASLLGRQLARLDVAMAAADMNLPGWGLHPLSGRLAGHYSITVNGNWRLTFLFEGEDAVLVDDQDCH
jgi:toxin HigB-1